MADDDEKDRGIGRTHNVMGVPLEVYRDGHVEVNEDLLADRIERKIDHKVESYVSGCVINVVLGVFVILLLVGVAAYIAFAVYRGMTAEPRPMSTSQPSVSASAAPGQPTDTAWAGTAPLTCEGNQRMRVSNVTANLAGQSAIVARGNCQLRVENSDVTGKIGIEAGANAVVTFVGGSLTGSEAAVKAGANAQVTLQGARVQGKRASSASARIAEKAR